MKPFFAAILLLFSLGTAAQRSKYTDSLKSFRDNYIQTHEVVKDADRKYLEFFPINKKYSVSATFEKTNDPNGFIMKTSGTKPKKYFKYGILHFKLDNRSLQLTVYQSEQLMKDDKYRNYLFVPYTDLTTGNTSYGGGKYMDFVMEDIRNNKLVIDFNKAYNPYCAYATGYNCPIPPRENDLPVAIKAGEMNYGKSH